MHAIPEPTDVCLLLSFSCRVLVGTQKNIVALLVFIQLCLKDAKVFFNAL